MPRSLQRPVGQPGVTRGELCLQPILATSLWGDEHSLRLLPSKAMCRRALPSPPLSFLPFAPCQSSRSLTFNPST